MKDSRKLDIKGFGNKRGPNKPSQDDQLINGRSEIKKQPRIIAKKDTGMHDKDSIKLGSVDEE